MSYGILVGNPGLGEGCQMVQSLRRSVNKTVVVEFGCNTGLILLPHKRICQTSEETGARFSANHLVLHAFGHVMQKPSFLVQEKCTIFCKRQIEFVSTLGVYQQQKNKKLELASLVGTQHFQRHTHTKKNTWRNPIPRCLPSVAIPIQGSIPPYSTFSQFSTRQLVWHVKKVHSNSETARALPSAGNCCVKSR